VTRWHRHETIWLGGRYLAHAEKFEDGRPIREDGYCGTIRTGEGMTREAAENALEARLD
jgi:hypothetical protein